MRGMTRPATARPDEGSVFGRPRQAAVLTAAVVALTAVVFVLAASHGTMARIQRADDAWLRLMITRRTPPVTAIAKVFNVLGLVYVTLPVRITLAGYLAARRRWWHLAAFTAAIVLSEALIGPLKNIYHRARPPGTLVATSGASFPSGHAIAASVTVLAAVIALVPAGRRRTLWAAAAMAFAILMGLSRAYLGAHWLSDATAGILLGTSCALLPALIAGQLQRQRRPPGRNARPPSPRQTTRPGNGNEYETGTIGRMRPAEEPDDGLPTGRIAPATGDTAGTSNAAALAQATTGAPRELQPEPRAREGCRRKTWHSLRARYEAM
jgi:membrane-associated phospholipid phosphatase